jgi:hypothetical protein
MATNRRKFRRMALKTTITATDITSPEGKRLRRGYKLPLEDLSASGLRYSSRFAVPVGTKLDLLFQLADQQLKITAQVVRTQKNSAGSYDIGCTFVGLEQFKQDAIVKFVTLSSVHQAQPSAFYTQLATRPQKANVPISCNDCRCSECGDRDFCKDCIKPNCGKRFCRMFKAGRQDLRRNR